MNEEEFTTRYPFRWPDFVRLFDGTRGLLCDIELPVRIKSMNTTSNDRPLLGVGNLVLGMASNGPPLIELEGIDASGRCELRVISRDDGQTWEPGGVVVHHSAPFRDFVEGRVRVEQERQPADLAGDAARAIAKAEKVFKDETDRVRRR